MKVVNVPQFIDTGKGVILNLHYVSSISFWKIQTRLQNGMEASAKTVSPSEWVFTPECDRYITLEMPNDDVIYQFYDGIVMPVADMGSSGSATDLFRIIFGSIPSEITPFERYYYP